MDGILGDEQGMEGVMVAVSGMTWVWYVLTMPETRHNVSSCPASPGAVLGTEIEK